jgi:N-acetylglucosamine PTS system EIICBA or EIICB component
LGVHLGFGFSAGLFDYVLNFSQATRPLMLIPMGLLYFGLYYGLFRYFIVRFDLKTLGREADETPSAASEAGASSPVGEWITALGGVQNLRAVDACTTRLRLVVADQATLDEKKLKSLGARGVLRLSDGAVQVVVGPVADQLASDIRVQARTPVQSGETRSAETRVAPVVSVPDVSGASIEAALRALGGKQNLRTVRAAASRLVITVYNPERVDERSLQAFVRAVARPSPANIQLIIGPDAEAWCTGLQEGRA